MTIDAVIATLISRGYEPSPFTSLACSTVKREAFDGNGFVTISGEPSLRQIYVSLTHNKGGSLARWCALDADAIEAFIARAERILTEWDSMEVTFNAPVNA